MNGPTFIYGNWASYDELSDGIELTEELAIFQLGELLRLRRSGVRFDAYLMDAFWFAPDGGYREWRRPHWPNGPDRWLAACREHGLLPGLWFTANTLCHLEAAQAWRDSVDAKGWGMCLFSGGFLADFLGVLAGWYGRGVRIFKFDFADFAAVPADWDGPESTAEIRVRNVEAFRSALREFRAGHPDAVLLGYNGFDEHDCMDRTDRPFDRFIDPAWLEVFDSLYCGDPRPADVPCLSIWRSVDIYSDHMTRAFAQSGIPLDRIENCGFMAGNTGTCYWRGKAGWQGMLLLSLARGGRYHVAYGDLSLFDDADARWWAHAQRLFAPSMFVGLTKACGGLPGRGEPYGWHSNAQAHPVSCIPSAEPSEPAPMEVTENSLSLLGKGEGRGEGFSGDSSVANPSPAGTLNRTQGVTLPSVAPEGLELLTVVNPSLVPAALDLPPGEWHVLAHDPGFVPPLHRGAIHLAGNQLAVLSRQRIEGFNIDDTDVIVDASMGLWPFAPPERSEGFRSEGSPNPHDVIQSAAKNLAYLQPSRGASSFTALVPRFVLDDSAQCGAKVTVSINRGPEGSYLVVQQVDKDGFAKRTYPTDEQPHAFRITYEVAGEKVEIPPMPDRRIWSGMSWTVVPLPQNDDPVELTVESNDPLYINPYVSNSVTPLKLKLSSLE